MYLTSKSGMGMLQAEHEERNDFVFREIEMAILFFSKAILMV